MIDTVEKGLSPLLLTAFFLSYGILRYPINQPRYRLSIFYILCVWSVYAYLFYYMMILFSLRRMFNLLTILTITANLLIIIISIIIIICKHKKYWLCIRKLDFVDDTLEELGIPKEYHKMRNVTRQALIMWFLMTCATWISDSVLWIAIHDDVKAILIPTVLSYPSWVNSIMDINFFLLLRHIGTRLDKINGHTEQLSETEDYGLRCKWKKSLVVNGHCVRNAENRRRVLWIVIHLHSELCRTARNINDFFGMQMTLQMINYFIVLNAQFYYECYMMLHLKEMYGSNIALKVFLSSHMWFIMYLIKLISLNHICESVSAKAQKTKSIIHKLTNLICFAEMREEIYLFVLQISLRPLKFSGLGLFYFGYGFLRKFFVWIITTLLFLQQIDFKTILQWTQNAKR